MIKLHNRVSDSNISKAELVENIEITKISYQDYNRIVEILSNCFDLSPNEVTAQFLFSQVDLCNSVKAIDKRSGEIYGVLIFCNYNITVGTPILHTNPLLGKLLQPFKQINGHSFVLDERLRGLGIDKKMLEYNAEYINQHKFIWCAVENSLKSHNYWKRLGFVEVLSNTEAKFYIKSL